MSQLVESPPVARKKDERFEMRVDPAWLRRVEKQAQRFGLSAAAYIRQCATEKLEKDERSDPDLKASEAGA